MIGIKHLENLIEIPAFLVVFSMFLQNPVFTNLILYRTCYINLEYNESDCALLGTGNSDNYTKILDKAVEPLANSISMYIQLPVILICAFLAILVGSWADRNGRKPILLYTISGQGMSFALIAIFCYFPSLSPWYLYYAMVPVIMTGSTPAIMSTIMTYASDISDERSRGARLGSIEATLQLGSLAGTFSSSHIFKMMGYPGIFIVASGCFLAALCFTFFVIKESLPKREPEHHTHISVVQLLTGMVKSTFKKRPSYERSLILICILTCSVVIFATMSDIGIIYLFLQLEFGWSLHTFTTYMSTRELLGIVGMFIGIYILHKRLKVDEAILTIVGLISFISSSTTLGLAKDDTEAYFAAGLRCLSGCVNPMIRTVLSKVAKPYEIGKFFGVIMMCQSILHVVGAPTYTFIYNETLNTVPNLYNFLSAGIYCVGLLLTLVIIILRSKTRSAKAEVLDGDVIDSSKQINGVHRMT